VLDGFEHREVIEGGAPGGRDAGTGSDGGADQFPGEAGAAPAAGDLAGEPGDRRAGRTANPSAWIRSTLSWSGTLPVAEDLGEGHPAVLSALAVLGHERERGRDETMRRSRTVTA
jgi:hypothetical protein